MGYYTRYSLECFDPDLIGGLIQESSDASCALEEDGSSSGEGIKWYDHEDELRAFSKKHPKVLFTLRGEGEDNNDMWVKYFKNGKMQLAKAKITFDVFDPKRLR